MGNSQKPQQQINTQIAVNLGQFLPQIQVQETPNDIQPIIAVPPTPCFKQQAKIQVIPNEILTKMYEKEDKLKQQKQFQILLQTQDKQIYKAKANYEKRMQQNHLKFKQIKARKERCHKVYEQKYDSMDEKDEEEKQNDQQHTEIIWGKKICTKFFDPKDQYLKHRFPKEDNLDDTEDYRNWHIYKQKMYKDQMQKMNDQEERLINLETDLKHKYQTLLQRKQQRINSSTPYAELKERQQNSYKKRETPSPKKKNKRQKESQSANSSSLSPRKVSDNRSQQTTKIDLSESFNKQTQNGGQSPSFIFNFLQNTQNKNPQHWSPQSPETDFFAKQIFYYQSYSSKRRSSFIYSRDKVQRMAMEENQYPPKKKNYERPVRCQEKLRDNASFRSKSKSPKKRAKFQEDLLEIARLQREGTAETSVYQKVYEKIPKKQARMMYSSAQGKLKVVQDFYPYQGSPSQSKDKQVAYPQKMNVKQSLGYSPPKQIMEFRISGKKKTPKQQLVYDFMERDSGEQRAVELTPYQKELYRKKRSQRDYEAKILQRLKMKKIS